MKYLTLATLILAVTTTASFATGDYYDGAFPRGQMPAKGSGRQDGSYTSSVSGSTNGTSQEASEEHLDHGDYYEGAERPN